MLEEKEMPTKLAEFLLNVVVFGDFAAKLDQLQQEPTRYTENEHNRPLHTQLSGNFSLPF